MVRSPRTHRRRRGWPLTAGLVVVLSGATAANAIAATQSWTIVANRSSVPLGTPATVTLTIVNTSSEKGGGAGIGCVAIAIPAAYTPTGVNVVSVTSGLSWTAGLSASAPRGIKATAASNGDRLQGDPIDDVLVLQVHVNGRAVGSAAWTANEFQNSDCSGSYRKPVRISMSVVPPAAATPRPTAQPTARPTPTPAPQATTPATPTASPSSTPPGATPASGASSTPATPPSPGSGRSGGSTGGRGGAAVGSTSAGGSGDSAAAGPTSIRDTSSSSASAIRPRSRVSTWVGSVSRPSSGRSRGSS